MYKLPLVLLFAAVAGLVSCGTRHTTPVEEPDTTRYALATEEGPGADSPIALPTAEATYGGHTYTIDINRHASDSLPSVKDDYDDPYLDNVVTLSVKVDGAQTVQRRVTKSDFSAAAEGLDFSRLIFGGMVFGKVDGSGLHFNAVLNEPGNEESGFGFLLTVNPHTGAVSAQRDRTPDDLKSEVQE